MFLSIVRSTLFAAAAATGAVAAAAPTDVEAALDQLVKAGEAADRNDCPAAMKLAEPLGGITKPALPAPIVEVAQQILVICDLRAGDKAAAYRRAVAATERGVGNAFVWQMRMGFEIDDARLEAAVVTVEQMAKRPAVLSEQKPRWLYDLDNKLNEANHPDLRRRLLEVLIGGAYSPQEPGSSIDAMRLRLARLLDPVADHTRIASLVGAIEEPNILVDVLLDRQLRGFAPMPLDLRALAEKRLAGALVTARENPDLISPVRDASYYLRALGRPQEALAELETIRDRVADPKAFTDREDQIAWWWDELARVYEMLGRYPESIAALRSGAGLNEGGSPNVSQVINLSQSQMAMGMPAAALATLTEFDRSKRPVSPFGQMQIEYVRACAGVLSGNKPQAAAATDYIRAHEKDASRTVTETLLCIGDADGAAASMIRRLDDPKTRSDALRHVADYDSPPVVPRLDPWLTKLKDVKARSDVRAAIDRAGGTIRIPLQPESF